MSLPRTEWPIELLLAEENAARSDSVDQVLEELSELLGEPMAEYEGPLHILLVEDNPGDVRLATEALRDCRVPNRLSVVMDGVEAIEYLRNEGPYEAAPRPDLILLDLNLPRKDGREVLAELKSDEILRDIPVVVLTTSDSETDVSMAYGLSANCFITKPAGLEEFVTVMKSIQYFWSAVARLPR